MAFETLKYEVRDGVGICTFNRPDEANAMNFTMMQELMEVALDMDDNKDVRAALFTGEGAMFCAGGDLKSFAGMGDATSRNLKHMATVLHNAITRLQRMDAPVIAAVNGTAAGAGFSFAVQCDLVVSSDQAKYVMAYTAGGLSPDGSASYFLPRRIGSGRSLELMMTNRVLSAQEALDWGLVNRVVPADDLLDEAMKLATTLAKGPTAAFGTVKDLVHNTWNETLESQMERETTGIAGNAAGRDGQEGIDAFVNKRKPDFKGTR